MSEMLELRAPLSGSVVALGDVPDPVFAGLMMGDGLAVDPVSSVVLAPCDGVVSQLARTGHALTLTAANGAEILIHVGIDTVTLGGTGFTPRVALQQAVRRGQPLIEVDFDAIRGKVPSLLTVLAVTNSDAYSLGCRATGQVVAGESVFLGVAAAGAALPDVAVLGREVRAGAMVRHAGGLHARPAALVQHAAKPFDAQVSLVLGDRQANARSVVALMGLGVEEGQQVTVVARGEDAEAACQAVVVALETRTEAGHGAVAAPVVTRAESQGALFRGVQAAPGLAIGRLVLVSRVEQQVEEAGGGVAVEADRLATGLAAVREAIAAGIRDAESRGATHEAEIFGAHAALLEDPELQGAAELAMASGKSAPFAFREAVRAQCGVLLATGNPLLMERVADLRDLERRVLTAMGVPDAPLPTLYPASVLVADDLAPSDLTRLPREQVAAIVTARGGATSHVAILARGLGIPALVAAGERVLALEEGLEVVVDGQEGVMDSAPSPAYLTDVRARLEARREARVAMRRDADGEARTLDGFVVEVAANVGSADDAREAAANGADGVGLTRTEFLFIERTEAPDPETQRASYQAVLDAMGDRSVIIRTLDVGGDKEAPYLSLPAEPNPALGLRGVRTSFALPELLDAQLTALLSVRPLSRLRILVPMVADAGELLRLRAALDATAARMGVSERPELGVMIEVPSAALLADQLAQYADFLSIGTNDLTQYTLAMDRCNPALADRIDAMHPAVLRLIGMACEGAARHGKWVGVCGAMASDPEAVPVLVGLGVAELSVSPGLVPEIKARVRTLDGEVCRREAQRLLAQPSAAEVRTQVRMLWPAT